MHDDSDQPDAAGRNDAVKQTRQINALLKEIYHKHGKRIVARLQRATPVGTGETARSWGYKVDLRKTHKLEITTDSIVAKVLLYGAKGHWVPKNDGGFVAFVPTDDTVPNSDGRIVREQVYIPARKGSPKLRRIQNDGLNACYREVESVLLAHMDSAWNG